VHVGSKSPFGSGWLPVVGGLGQAIVAPEEAIADGDRERRTRRARGPRRLGQGDWGSLTEPRAAAGAEGGGTTGPMSPSGASSRSTITGA
jgi:hypothetical protein